jgi:hypothetical protein
VTCHAGTVHLMRGQGSKHLRICSVSLLCAAVLSTCGGGGSGTATTAPVSPTDQKITDAAVLTLADFPPGWRADKPSDESGGADKCWGDAKIVGAVTRSMQFAKDNAVVGNTTRLAVDTTTAMAFMTLLRKQTTIDCLKEVLTGFFATNVKGKVESVKFGQLSTAPIGDDVVAYQIAAVVSVGELKPSAYFDLLFVRVGRGITYVVAADALAPFPESDRNTLARKVVDRLRAEVPA